jgi:ABC-2 type transport system ATP-binding protein
MIQVENLTKQYGRTVAVDDLSFTVQPGTVTGFLGPNGAGKSTAMRLILGLDAPNRGTATVNGHSYRQIRYPLFEVGALLDARAMHGGRSAYHHLLCLAQSNRIPARRVGEVLDLVGIESATGRRTKGFSLGMSQRLGIAAALLGDPGVLMFDEPVNGLDPEGILWIRGLLRGFAAQGRTVLVSSHLMSEMAQTADHLVVIGKGKLIAQQSTAELIANSVGNHVVVRTPDPVAMRGVLTDSGARVEDRDDGSLAVFAMPAQRIGELAAARALVLHELSPRLTSLESAFFELTDDSVEYRTTTQGAARQS